MLVAVWPTKTMKQSASTVNPCERCTWQDFPATISVFELRSDDDDNGAQVQASRVDVDVWK
jgi:hypothetical protein